MTIAIDAAIDAHSDLAGLDFPAFSAWVAARVGHSARFHRALYRQFMQTGRLDPAALPLWREAEAARPGTIDAITAAVAGSLVPEVTMLTRSDDAELGTTTKVKCRLADGAEVETVLVPMGLGDPTSPPSPEFVSPSAGLPVPHPRSSRHWTVCVSTQVGCRMGCHFCHTASMGLVRNLTAHEIVGQFLAISAATGVRPRNLVFMGMGEPLDNAEEVGRAVRVLTDHAGLGLAHRHITVSTVGRIEGLRRLAETDLDRINLAVSLFAADDAVRSIFVPTAKSAPLADLHAALTDLKLPRGRRILISLVVIPGINDGQPHVDALKAWIAGLPVLVNLIPYHPIPGKTWPAPTSDQVAAMSRRLDEARIPVRIRRTKGEAVMAACGQLAVERNRSE